ncbi:MAG: ATP-binding cassette domain-containing protein, partial [Betaproteobacteria bacterium]|nr:ATP-binding cassette domain-containing protein [Betaproteobacteria bacterium]
DHHHHLTHAHVSLQKCIKAHGDEGALKGKQHAVSGGERQRVAIARAFVKNAPILILDEATSALDSQTESLIQDAIDQLCKGRTVIAIAHRLSTLARMDRILVMDQGRIIESGTHDQLLAAQGHYALLWQRQSAGFIGA